MDGEHISNYIIIINILSSVPSLSLCQSSLSSSLLVLSTLLSSSPPSASYLSSCLSSLYSLPWQSSWTLSSYLSSLSTLLSSSCPSFVIGLAQGFGQFYRFTAVEVSPPHLKVGANCMRSSLLICLLMRNNSFYCIQPSHFIIHLFIYYLSINQLVSCYYVRTIRWSSCGVLRYDLIM